MREWQRTLVSVVVIAVVTAAVLGAVYLLRGQPVAAPSVEASTQVAVGQPAPEIKALDIEGKPVALELYQGQPVWLLFQATWCSNCRAEIADVTAAAEQHGARVVAVYLSEDKDLVADYVSRLELGALTNVPDPTATIAATYGAASVPTHFFIDGDGVLRAVRKGALTPEAMDEELAALVTP